MSRNVKIGLVQFESILLDTEANANKAVELANQAADEGANIICFPEMFTTGYNLDIIKENLFNLAENLEGNTVSKLCKVAKERGVYIIASLALESDLKGVLLNSSVLINEQGEIDGVYSKNHLWALERFYFKNGNEIPVFETKYGKIGIMICYDAGFPETARILALKGAEIIFMPSAWRIQDKDMWDINISARSLENTVFVAAVNRFGREGDLYLFGNSKVANTRGKIIAESLNECEEILICDVDLDELSSRRAIVPYLKDRRPEQYSLISQQL